MHRTCFATILGNNLTVLYKTYFTTTLNIKNSKMQCCTELMGFLFATILYSYYNSAVREMLYCVNGSCFSAIITKTCLSNIMKILPPINESFQIKNSDIFHISTQNKDCGYSLEPPGRCDSNEYPQSMFMSRNKKKCIPGSPQFDYINVGFKEVKII